MAQDQRRHPAFDVRIRGRRHGRLKNRRKRVSIAPSRVEENVNIDPKESHGSVEKGGEADVTTTRQWRSSGVAMAKKQRSVEREATKSIDSS